MIRKKYLDVCHFHAEPVLLSYSFNDEITNRDRCFGSRYSSSEKTLITNIDSLSRKNVTSDTEKEDYQEWKQRVIASLLHDKYVPFEDDEVEVHHGWVDIKGR